MQLAFVGKGDKARNVLLLPEIGSAVLAMRGDAAVAELVFLITLEHQPISARSGRSNH